MTKDARPLMVTIRCFTYNHEPYIRQCLEGFVMQKTNFRFEAIVHDDASTDGTAAIVREYAEKYPDIIKPIFETENQYSKHDGSLRKIMDEHMHGKYIAFCEGDDYWIDPLKLQKQVDFLEVHLDYGMCYTEISKFNQKNGIFIHNYLQSRNEIKNFQDHIMNTGYIAPCSWVYRSQLCKQFLYSNDYVDGSFPFALDIMANSKVFFLKEVTAVYRELEESASHSIHLNNRWRFAYGLFVIQQDYIKKYPKLLSDEQKKEIYYRTYKKLLPISIAIDKIDFVMEACDFLRNYKLDFKTLLCVRFKSMIRPFLIINYKLKGMIA